MPTLCPVCLRHNHACICIERQIPDGNGAQEWATEGFRFVGYRESAANPEKQYAVYRKHPGAS